MKSNIKFSLLAFGIMIALIFQECANTTSKSIIVPTTLKPTITTVLLAINVSTNDYRVVSAQRTIKDTLKSIVTDTANGRIVSEIKQTKDSSYLAWWPFPVQDSLRHTIKSKIILPDGVYPDSVVFRFVPVQRSMVVTDYNQNF